jgi:hypothetical protein
MSERPILFNAEMVRAVLDGRKVQTRRVMKVQPHAGVRNSPFVKSGIEDGHGKELICPFGEVGDRLWVRETWAEAGGNAPELQLYRASYPAHVPSHYENVPPPESIRWRPSIHMPRWASRITLEITGVRVERLQSISEEDAKAEGVKTECSVMGDKHFLGFRSLWKSICGDDIWQANPWVWVVEFKRAEGQ